MLDYDDWRERAACRDEDPELFFPLSDKAPDHGLFGGTTETDRRRLRRRPRTFPLAG